MVTIAIQQTYDLKTTVNKMGLIGIHTPPLSLVRSLWPGFLTNFKYAHLDCCHVAVACASVQPADPLQVGTEAGDIAPEDLFNPILYKAMSNESFDTLSARVYDMVGAGVQNTLGVALQTTTAANEFPLYYGLLQESGWRKAMPQQGLVMKGLVPLVHEVLSAYGNDYINPAGTNPNSHTVVSQAGAATTPTSLTGTPFQRSVFRGRSVHLPRLPTGFTMNQTITSPNNANPNLANQVIQPNNGDGGTDASSVQNWPKVMVASIVVPPAKQHVLYYRLRVVWEITFSEPISIVDRGTFDQMRYIGQMTHLTLLDSKADMQNVEDMADTNEMPMERIMSS